MKFIYILLVLVFGVSCQQKNEVEKSYNIEVYNDTDTLLEEVALISGLNEFRFGLVGGGKDKSRMMNTVELDMKQLKFSYRVGTKIILEKLSLEQEYWGETLIIRISKSGKITLSLKNS